MTKPHRSKIGWTDFSGGDANFVIAGPDCRTSPGCANCYALSILSTYGNLPGQTTFYPGKLRRLAKASFKENGVPFRRGPDSRPLVFVVDMGDLFHPIIDDDKIKRAVGMMAEREDVDWQVLTKRSGRMRRFFGEWPWWRETVPENIWLMVTAENQALADERIGDLIATPAAVRGVSLEPMLSSIKLKEKWLYKACKQDTGEHAYHPLHWVERPISWVIVGAESGNNRRLFDVDWARSIRAQCLQAGTAFFYKQGSHRFPGRDDVLDGRRWKQFPR